MEPARDLHVFESVLDCIGHTPLIRLRRVVDSARTPLYAKAEILNPGGSVKDRIGVSMLDDFERKKVLEPGGTIVEGTSGNTGIGLAIAAAVKGYRCIFTMPDKMSMEKVKLLKAFGAEVIITPTAVPPDSPENYVNVAKRIVEETPNSVLANQFYNEVNPDTHYRTTGPEIWQQTRGRITHFVAGAGTGGTISGVGRYLKERSKSVRVVMSDPQGSIFKEYHETHKKGEGHTYKVEGIGNDKIPGTLHFDFIDEVRTVTDKESFAMARRITREEGLFVGGSSGTAVHVAAAIARELDDPGALVVTVLPDWGERYLSKFHSDEWMRENRLLDTDKVFVGTLLSGKDRTKKPLVAAGPNTTARQALALMHEDNVSQLPVLHDGESIGSVSEGYLMRRVVENTALLDKAIEPIMETPFPVTGPGASLDHVTRLMTRDNPAVLIRDGNRFVGILTRFDVISYLTTGK